MDGRERMWFRYNRRVIPIPARREIDVHIVPHKVFECSFLKKYSYVNNYIAQLFSVRLKTKDVTSEQERKLLKRIRILACDF